LEGGVDIAAGSEESAGQSSVLLSITSAVAGIIQGACAVLVASSGAKILLGVAGLAAALKTSEFHREPIRIPLMALSAGLALITLFVLWNGHRMRNLPSARWRKRALTVRQKAGIGFSFATAMLTLVLVVAELLIHPFFAH
jgi:hypothetical protein